MLSRKTNFNYGWRLLCLLFIPLLITACDSGDNHPKVDLTEISEDPVASSAPRQAGQPHTYYFGFDLRGSPREDARQYLPFLEYLEQATGYDFELRFTPKGASTADELGKGTVQFAAIGATSFIVAHEQYDAVALVRGLNPLGKAEYQSIIVVAPDSRITTIEQLRGRRFAFGGRDSTQGHLIPRIVLGENGLGLADMAAYDYTGSHSKCANAVISGKYEACGMQDTMAKDLAQKGLVRILRVSAYYPSSGIAASATLPAEVLEKVRAALLAFEPEGQHQSMLYNWHKTEMPKGFVAARHGDYDKLRDWMIEFNMLDAKSETHEVKE